ncbi:polymeric immunoglobulin receptor [Triplophysa rosa]|uniref:CMRF35-like molecule 1 n=1 Tax=Triplophysa rosa TaxID=992332 RepID=A0A9W7T4U3_TRIRA|nr:polymeric immunoglobulin receptor [Triplophysa rosa]KAI7790529.1 putative CMRF35-like molecule 1 [Triplophysa rosa]
MFLQILTVLVVGHLQAFYCTVTTVGDLVVLEGQSVNVPCHYNPQYTSHVKYWCQGLMREFCTSLARTDDLESAPNGMGRVTIADDPTQHVFTVTMRNLMEGDSGWYWCGVEVGGMWISDSTASLYISAVQGVSVLSSAVSADEGDSISVHCNYSQNLRSSEKRWCRSGDWSSCVVTDSNGMFSSKQVLIRDDRKSAFTVTFQQLERRDSGYYWCAAGQNQVAVHVSVTPRTTTASSVQIGSTAALQPLMKSDDSHSHRLLESPWIVCGIVLCCVVIFAFLAILTFRQQCKKKHKHQETSELNDKLTMCPWKEGDYKNTSVIFLNTPAHQVHVV